MMRFEDCRQIGRIGKPHGHGGELKLELHADITTDLDLNEPVFLMIEGKPVPFFMVACNEAAQPPILHFEDCDDLEAARRLQGMLVYAPEHAVEGESVDSSGLIGFDVYHPEYGSCGKIIAILPSGLQELIQLETVKGEVLLPLQEEMIVQWDEENKRITLNFPLELLEPDY